MSKPLARRYRPKDRNLDLALEHVREAEALRRKYGEVFEDVKRTFLSLSPERLQAILDEYGKRYGASAREYAETTMKRWRSGGVIMSGQTMARLLDLVPRYLQPDEKFALVEKIRLETLKKLHRTELRIRLRPGDSAVHSLSQVLELIQKQGAVELPRSFYELKGWINAKDASMMQELVLALEQDALYARVVDLFYQISLLQGARKALPRAKLIQIAFDLPAARVIVAIDRAPRKELKKMQQTPEDDNDLLVQLQKIENQQRFQKGEMGFHEYLLRNMDTLFTPEQVEELRALAVKQGLELDRLKSEIVLKGQTSAHDIKAFVDLVEDLKAKKTHADVTGKYITPSGEIEIQAKTSRAGCSVWPFGILVAVSVFLVATHFK